jgi:hypothetical protein
VYDDDDDDDAPAKWSKVLVVGELKCEEGLGDLNQRVVIQLASYAYEMFVAQPGRRFVHAFSVINSQMRCWIFLRAGGVASLRFNLRTKAGLEYFRRVFVGYMTQNSYALGGSSGNVDVSSPHGGVSFKLDGDPLFRAKAIVSRATTCWPLSVELSNTDKSAIDWVLKDSWQWDTERQSEGELLAQCSTLGINGVAKAYRHDVVEHVHGILGEDILDSAQLLDLQWKANKRPNPYNAPSSDRSSKRSKTTTASESTRRSSTRSMRNSTISATRRNLRSSSAAIATSANIDPAEAIASETPVMPDAERSYEYVPASAGGAARTKIPNRLHRRIILERGTVVRDIPFISGHQLLLCLRDAIRGHRELLTKAGILHRDISINNIVLAHTPLADEYTAFLIDLDLAVPIASARASAKEATPKPAPKRTGTFEFMSIEMLFAQPGFTHCYYDDLQSFFFVLLWLCLSRSPYQAVFDGWGSATHSPNEAGKLKWGDIQVEALFAPLIEKFDSRWGHAVKKVAVSFRAALWPNLSLVDRNWVVSDQVRDALYERVIGVFEEGAEMAAREAV